MSLLLTAYKDRDNHHRRNRRGGCCHSPEPETAHKITKTKEGPSVQCMIYEEAIKLIEALENLVGWQAVTKTVLTMEG